MSQWRPIENAPKDGTIFLAPVDGVVCRVLWCKTAHVPLYGFHWYDDPDGEERNMVSPTHWMPLPDPPGPEGSPQLSEPTRSRERAAVDIAIDCLRGLSPPDGLEAALVRTALGRIEQILPGSTGRGPGE